MNVITRLRREESGFTLVELTVASLLLGVVLAIAGAMLVSSITGQRDVTNIGNATSGAQLVAGSIEDGIRNASSFSVTNTTYGQQIKSRTATFTASGNPTWICRSWIATTDNRVLTASSTSGPVATVTGLSSTALSGWTLLAANVTVPSSASQAFVAGTTPRQNLNLNLQVGVDSGDGKPALISTQVSQLPLPTTTGTGPSTCL